MRIAFGLECNSFQNPNNKFKEAGNDFFRPTFRNSVVMSLMMLAPGILRFFNMPIAPPKVQKFFLDAVRQIVDYREKYFIEEKDVMSLLIRLKNNKNIDDKNDNENNSFSISFNELAAQAFAFFIGGYETTSSTMSFLLHQLALHDDVQRKVREEIKAGIKKHGGVTYDALTQMTYLDCCINGNVPSDQIYL